MARSPPSKIYDVRKFGAVPDGKTDNRKAFLKTFNEACQYKGQSHVVIPKGTFLVSIVEFVGPCRGPINFYLRGVIKAGAGIGNGKGRWITFRHINRLTVTGGGTFDGQGETAWHHNDCSQNPNCPSLPISIRFDFVRNSLVSGITSLNSKNFHINVMGCTNLRFKGIRIIAPSESPNTDGIHIGLSSKILISKSIIATGDDCISMGPGSRKIHVRGVWCGPGHGISIGSLGKYPDEDDVSDITVKDSVLQGTENGLRIKSWASSHECKVFNVLYQNIIMKDVNNPIFIDQQYCPSGGCDNSKASSVQIHNVRFQKILGTSKSKEVVKLRCSSRYPCRNIKLRNIDISYRGPHGPGESVCLNVNGRSTLQKAGSCAF
ncbi:hypothetical protein SAY87_009480 [Trapa incisa]|uniref:Uncharacterized protein n=1 Tax=Trapa incisa TaxID=236973 RepID=A0AAN7K1S4_9MYRT|nr:hypothetical protein SAY87_009480 [Trapa incisa]